MSCQCVAMCSKCGFGNYDDPWMPWRRLPSWSSERVLVDVVSSKWLDPASGILFPWRRYAFHVGLWTTSVSLNNVGVRDAFSSLCNPAKPLLKDLFLSLCCGILAMWFGLIPHFCCATEEAKCPCAYSHGGPRPSHCKVLQIGSRTMLFLIWIRANAH